MSSGDRISYFFEEKGLDERANFTREAYTCINKIGHAMHDIDPIFKKFSYS